MRERDSYAPTPCEGFVNLELITSPVIEFMSDKVFVFLGGKKCPSCGNRIFHDKWKVTPRLAEARWAHKEAKNRELAEVEDFLKDCT